MKTLVLAFVVLLHNGCGAPAIAPDAHAPSRNDAARDDADRVVEAFKNQRGNISVELSGTVDKLLADDRDGSRHQRFVLRLSNDHTVLVAHNIDLASRVEGLRVGDSVRLKGEYEWNPKGGVVHWTHHDPEGRQGGWIEHEGRTYR